jgi:hypothetical protein
MTWQEEDKLIGLHTFSVLTMTWRQEDMLIGLTTFLLPPPQRMAPGAEAVMPPLQVKSHR